ncbi:MAG TPA: response regulator transcription factor [Rhizomicrobium sp.]|jgi:two-component system cell cycle response regulator CtrA
MRVLLVDHDEVTVRSIRNTMRAANMCLDTCTEGTECLDMIRHYDYDAIILGATLADISGLDLVRKLRNTSVHVPLLFLADVDAETRVAALNNGADDCISRRLHPDELIGRIKALVRRSRGYANPVITIGTITLNLSAKTVETDGRRIRLTDMEYRILELLLLRRGVAVTRETFISHLYGDEDGPESRTIELFVCKLRKKLSQATGGDSFIETIRQHGYLLRHVRAA